MSHRKTDLGIPRRSKSAKVVLDRRSVLLEKPLVLVVPEGRTVSPKLEGIADRISTVDLESEAAGSGSKMGCGGSSPTSPNNDRSIRLPALSLREPHHPKDKEYGYCVRCHVFTGDAEMMPEPRAAELERDFFVATSPEAQAGRASDYVTAAVLAIMWCNALQTMALWPWLMRPK